jgi:hypothetical protein
MPLKARPADTKASPPAPEASDRAVLELLKRIEAATDPAGIKQLSDRLERAIFHKQFENS